MIRTNLLSIAVITVTFLSGCNEQRRSGEETRTGPVDWSKPHIVVEPQTTRSIQGVSEVDRKRYFSVSDAGAGFSKRVKDDAMYDYLVNDLEIAFGRELGPVKYTAKSLKEDPARPGYADITPLEKKKLKPASERMLADFGPNLDVASHGNHNAFPEFMGRYETELSKEGEHPQYIPENIDAAAALSAAVMKYNYTDLDRPRYYEPVNEPHWSFFGDPHFADWHLKTMETVHASTPDVKVGGMCMSVCYFYRSNYKSFSGMQKFMTNTDCQMDFYSFHTYDYLRWIDGEFRGRLQSGLPLEGTLDIVPNYSMNEFGKEVDLVVSEQGGYIGSKPKGMYDGELVAAEIMKEHHPDADPTTWDYEMKKRSIVSFGHISSIIANTLAFMDHPHTVMKSVPFLLVNTWAWDPKYYAGLYIPKNYEDESQWVETSLTDFYKFFRGVAGRRVKALCSDPDLQTRAFVNGNKLYLAVNNQSLNPESIGLHGITTENVEIRRLGRNADFTGNYSEETVATPETLNLAGRESLMIVADYGSPITETATVNEQVCYGDKTAVPLEEATFTIATPRDKEIDYAILRVGMTRPPGTSQSPVITLNGKTLDVPLEDSAGRYTDKEYATTKLVSLDPNDLQAENTVTVTFPDGNEGSVGSAVIRLAVKE